MTPMHYYLWLYKMFLIFAKFFISILDAQWVNLEKKSY